MKSKLIVAISFAVLSLSATAQENYGFYGKKNFIEVTSSSYVPLIYNSFSGESYKVASYNAKVLEPAKKWLHTGARVGIGRAIRSDLGFSVEFGYDNITLGSGGYYTLFSYESYNPTTFEYVSIEKHERLKVHSILISPKIEISGNNGLLPNGLVHQIGVGVTVNSVAKKNYLVKYTDNSVSGGPKGTAEEQEALFEDQNLEGTMKMIQLLYGLKMRTPVGKNLMLNYGFRYTIDVGSFDYAMNGRVTDEIKRYQFRNVIAFDLGLTLPF